MSSAADRPGLERKTLERAREIAQEVLSIYPDPPYSGRVNHAWRAAAGQIVVAFDAELAALPAPDINDWLTANFPPAPDASPSAEGQAKLIDMEVEMIERDIRRESAEELATLRAKLAQYERGEQPQVRELEAALREISGMPLSTTGTPQTVEDDAFKLRRIARDALRDQKAASA